MKRNITEKRLLLIDLIIEIMQYEKKLLIKLSSLNIEQYVLSEFGLQKGFVKYNNHIYVIRDFYLSLTNPSSQNLNEMSKEELMNLIDFYTRVSEACETIMRLDQLNRELYSLGDLESESSSGSTHR